MYTCFFLMGPIRALRSFSNRLGLAWWAKVETIQPNGIVNRLAKVIANEKLRDISQTGSVVDNCLIVIAT